MSTYPIFSFLLDFFNMLIEWGNQLWNVITYPVLDNTPLWLVLVVVGAVSLVVIWLAKIII